MQQALWQWKRWQLFVKVLSHQALWPQRLICLDRTFLLKMTFPFISSVESFLFCTQVEACFKNLAFHKISEDLRRFRSMFPRGAARIFLRGGLKLWKQKP